MWYFFCTPQCFNDYYISGCQIIYTIGKDFVEGMVLVGIDYYTFERF